MVGALTDPFDTVHMGVTAENVATQCGITRKDQDEFAVESHRRAASAIACATELPERSALASRATVSGNCWLKAFSRPPARRPTQMPGAL